MKKIKFSVLMSVYYKEKASYLDDALNSIFSQTLKPNEVVLVEDGPLNDDLYKVIDKYKKKYKYFKTVRLKKNMGLGNALNEGLKHCSYEYVARMDTDDISMPDRFEKQIRYLEKHPEVDLIGSNIAEYDEDMINITGYRIVPESNDEIKEFMKKRNPFNHMSVIYKKGKVFEAGNYLDMPYFEDYYLWSRMAVNNCAFYNIQENLIQVRGGTNMIKRRGGKKYLSCIKRMEYELLELKIIKKREYYINLLVRSICALIPNRIRKLIYKKVLRK